MKKALPLSLFVLLVLLSASCSKDAKLSKEIAGTWRVAEITFKYSNGDSVVTGPNIGTFYFGACRWQKEKDDACKGYYQFKRGNRTNYGYAAFAEKNRISFFLLPGEPEMANYSSMTSYKAAQAVYWGDQPRFNTIWDILHRTDDQLLITGTLVHGYLRPSGPALARTVIKLTR